MYGEFKPYLDFCQHVGVECLLLTAGETMEESRSEYVTTSMQHLHTAFRNPSKFLKFLVDSETT